MAKGSQVVVAGGDNIIDKPLLKALLNHSVVVCHGDLQSIVNSLKTAEPFLNAPFNNAANIWRGGRRKKGGKIGYQRF